MMRSALKTVLATAAGGTGGLALLRASRLLTGPEVRLFGYHRIVDDAASTSRFNMPPMCVSTRVFAAHLDHLARNYQVLSLDAAAEVLTGARPAPKRPVAVITFDDGYLDVLTHAAPLLRERGMPATVFVTTDVVTTGRPFAHDRVYALCNRAFKSGVRLLGTPVADEAVWPLARADRSLERGDVLNAAEAILLGLPGRVVDAVADALAARLGEPGPQELAPLLTWDDLAQLPALGVDVGSHGVTHGHMPLEDDAGLMRELAESRAEIGRRLGRAPNAVVYPAGRYDDRVVEFARRAGYTIGLTTEEHANRKGADLLRLGRKTLHEAHGPTPALIAAHLDGLFGALGLARAVPGAYAPAKPMDVTS